MEELSIRLQIDFKESIDVRAFTGLLDSVNKLGFYRAERFGELEFIHKEYDGLLPTGLKIKNINNCCIEIKFVVDAIIGGLIYDGIKKILIKIYEKIRQPHTANIRERIPYFDPEEYYQVRNICNAILNGKMDKVRFAFSDGAEYEINKHMAKSILSEFRSYGKSIKYVRRILNNVPMRIYHDDKGQLFGAIGNNKTSYPVSCANSWIKDQIISWGEPVTYYVEVEDIRMNGKTSRYEVRDLYDIKPQVV